MTRKEMLLVQLMEEAAEVVQGASKCLRFGTNHEWPSLEKTAEYRLMTELIDLSTLVKMCRDEGVIEQLPVDYKERMEAKEAKVNKYMQLSTELGKIT